MPLFHIATVSDWDAAQASGRYTTSTRGRTLAEEGFIHASRADQWQGVHDRFYADVNEPLVLLVIDPDLLSAPVVDEQVPGSAETFPHVYGAIETAAVVRVLPIGTTPTPPPVGPQPSPAPPRAASGVPRKSFFTLSLEDAGLRAGIGLVVLVSALLLGVLALHLWGDVSALRLARPGSMVL